MEGGQTLGFEIAQQISRQHPSVDAIRVRSCKSAAGPSAGCPKPSREPGCWAGQRLSSTEFLRAAAGQQPLHRVYSRLAETQTLQAAAKQRDAFMSPWEDPQSVAFGILDDETYDWVALCELCRPQVVVTSRPR